MYGPRPGLLIGFHGCEETFRDGMISGGIDFKPSINKYDWLGHGIYFWEGNAQRALHFAEELRDKPQTDRLHIIKPAVLGAVIDLGHCLDLVDSRYLRLVQISHASLQFAYEQKGIALPKNRNPKESKEVLLRELDCAVIENVHKENKGTPFDSVRSAFTEGDPLYAGAGFHEKNHIQICIRNPNCIKGFFLPRREVIWP